MSRSEPVERPKVGDPPLEESQLQALISGLIDRYAKENGVDDDEQKSDVYLLLHPDVRRLLVQLGRTENKPLLRQLLKLDTEDLADLTAMLRDYREAKKLGKLIRAMAIGLGAFLSALVAVVKGAPDFLDWLRGLLPK